MTKTFEEAVTKKQREELVSTSVKALTELVGSPERKNIIGKIKIAEIRPLVEGTRDSDWGNIKQGNGSQGHRPNYS